MLIPLFETDVHSKIHIGKAMAHNSKILIRVILKMISLSGFPSAFEISQI